MQGMSAANKGQLPKWLAIVGTFAALLVSIPELAYGNDFAAFVTEVLIFLAVSMVILVVAAINVRRNYLSVIAMIISYCFLLRTFHTIAPPLRAHWLWFTKADDLKRQIRELPNPPAGQLRHVEWEEWGFTGSGFTTAYVVFDPTDALSGAAKSRSSGRFPGLPCEAFRVRRFEKYWYTVQFYTDTYWDYCGETNPR